MNVFVVGGTGAIGGHAVPALVRAAHTVTALARTPEKAAQLSKQGASPITVSMFDRAALTEAFKGHTAVINIASAIPPTAKFMQTKAWADNDRVRKEGSAAIVDAVIAAGVGRVVQESVSTIYPDRGAAWIDEACAPDTFPMAQANLAAEASANRFSAAERAMTTWMTQTGCRQRNDGWPIFPGTAANGGSRGGSQHRRRLR